MFFNILYEHKCLFEYYNLCFFPSALHKHLSLKTALFRAINKRFFPSGFALSWTLKMATANTALKMATANTALDIIAMDTDNKCATTVVKDSGYRRAKEDFKIVSKRIYEIEAEMGHLSLCDSLFIDDKVTSASRSSLQKELDGLMSRASDLLHIIRPNVDVKMLFGTSPFKCIVLSSDSGNDGSDSDNGFNSVSDNSGTNIKVNKTPALSKVQNSKHTEARSKATKKGKKSDSASRKQINKPVQAIAIMIAPQAAMMLIRVVKTQKMQMILYHLGLTSLVLT